MIKLTIDPEFQTIIPSLSPEEYKGLESALIKEGCRDSLVVWNNTLVDGHNRYEICKKHDIPFQIAELHFDTRDDAKMWIYKNQLSRRNLTDYTKSEIALAMKEIVAAKYKEQQIRKPESSVKEILPEQRGQTRDELGALAGVSGKTIDKVDYISKNAPEPMKEMLRTGELKIEQVYNAVKVEEKVSAKTNAVLFTSESEEWYTPLAILEAVYEIYENNLQTDPCSPVDNPQTKADVHYTVEDDGLKQIWNGKVFMNPPYGNVIGDWVSKAIDEYLNGGATEVIILVPARTDTTWFQSLVSYPWCAVKGRLKFSESKNSAPFPSAIFYLGENVKGFFENFEQFGPIFRRIDYMEVDVS
jgi:hypothetical protein